MSADAGPPRPRVSPDNAPFWEGCAAGELRLPFCGACQRPHLPPGPVCPYCLSPDLAWRRASGQGIIASWTILHQPGLPAFATRIPYNVIQVETEEGPRLTATLIDNGGAPPRIGQRVAVAFRSFDDGLVLPVFRPIDD